MLYTLDLPWGVKHPNVQYWKDQKIHVFKGSILPSELRKYASEDFSYSRWREDELNGMVMPPEKSGTKFSPKDHQTEAAKKIYKSYSRNDRGFLLSDKTGLGKTLSALAGISAIAKQEGFGAKNKGKLLIVCPKGVIPQWRQTLHNYPISTALLRVMIINYQQLNKLLEAPASARVAKKARTKNRQTASKGKPTVDWNYVIFDEAHYLKNFPTSTASMSATNIAKLENKYRKGIEPYTIFATATPGSSPLNFACMAGIIAPLLSNSPSAKNVTPSQWGEFLAKEGFAIKKTKSGYSWASVPWFGKNSDDPKERKKYEMATAKAKAVQRKDAQKIGRALTKPNAPFIMRSPKDLAGWPEQQIVPTPVQLTVKQIPIYEEAWTRFRNFLRLTPAKSDPKGALVERLRYKQKASLLKVDSMIEQIVDFVDSGHQVYISVEFIETIDRYKELLEKKKIIVAEISGRNVSERTPERLRFQKGEASVVISTVVEGISLHAEEILPDGTQATSNTRITIAHDLRDDPNATIQLLGRAHRDGKNSISYIPFIEKTVEENIAQSFANKAANMESMTGAEIDDAEAIERKFREAAAKSTPPNRLS